MRLIIFLVISLFLHFAAMVALHLPIKTAPYISKNNHFIQVIIKKKSMQPILSFNENLNQFTNTMQTNMLLNDTKIIDRHVESVVVAVKSLDSQSAIINKTFQKKTEDETTILDVSKYYESTKVDRKALPQVNIDESMLTSKDYSGLPIKLRLYISAFGRVVKIERISVLEQDTNYVSQLEDLLYDITFLPARRESLDVDSYQDLLFSFNPLPIVNSASDLN